MDCSHFCHLTRSVFGPTVTHEKQNEAYTTCLFINLASCLRLQHFKGIFHPKKEKKILSLYFCLSKPLWLSFLLRNTKILPTLFNIIKVEEDWGCQAPTLQKGTIKVSQKSSIWLTRCIQRLLKPGIAFFKKQTHRNVIHYSLNILKVTWNGNSSYLYFKCILIIVLWTVHPRMLNFLFIHWHCNLWSTDVSLVMHANHLIMDRIMDRTKYYIFFPLRIIHFN